MKLEQKDKQILFSTTQIPDIFFAEHMSNMPGDYLKIYMYLMFLSKYGKEVKINDLAKRLNLPLNVVNEGIKYLETNKLILRKLQGYLIVDLQEETLHELYKPNIRTTPEKVEENAKNKDRLKLITYLNNRYFQGVMGPTWYDDIDKWLTEYKFNKEVLITLFDYCNNKGALHRNYVQVVADSWKANNITDLGALENYYIEQEKTMKIKKSIAKKLGRHSGLTEFEEGYIDKWVNEYNYGMDVIELVLKRSNIRANTSFEYLDNIIKDWHERNLKTPAEVTEFLEKRKQLSKDTKDLSKKVKKENFEQRQYSNLSFLYANKNIIEGEGNG